MPARNSADTSRNVYVFGITSFLNDTASEMAYWILPAFLASIGAGPAQLGVIEGIAEGVAAAMKLLSGWLADKFPRRKPLVIAGYAIANLAKPLLAVAANWWQVLAIRFADRTAKGIRGAPRDVMLAESVEQKRLGSAFGLMQAMDTAGAIAGPLLALLIIARFHDHRHVFWFAAVPGLLSVIVVAVFARETHAALLPADLVNEQQVSAKAQEQQLLSYAPPHGDSDASDLSGYGPASPAVSAISGSYYYVLFAVTLFSLGNSSDMFLVLRAQERGISLVQAPLLGLVFNSVYTLASWPAGRLSDRVPRNLVAAAGFFVFAISYVVFAHAVSQPAIWVTIGFYGLYYALSTPVLKALVVDVVGPKARGRALGIYYFVTSIATLLASLVTGLLWKRFGASVPLYISAGLAALSAMMLLFHRPRKK